MNFSIRERVAASLTQAGLPIPDDFVSTLLLRERRFIGYKFAYDGGYAILRADSDAVELHSVEGGLLRSIPMAKESAA
jgi:hypothetical protein